MSAPVRKFLIVFGCVLLLFATAGIFPQALWGISGLSFLPLPLIALLLGLSLAAVLFLPKLADVLKHAPGMGFLLGISILYGIICYLTTVPILTYGDSLYIRPQLEQEISTWSDHFVTELLPHFLDPKTGTRHFWAILAWGSYLFQIPEWQVLEILQGILGALFAWTWLRHCRHLLQQPPGFIAGAGMGLLAPFTFLFMGHAEVYFLSVLAQMAFGTALIRYFTEPNARRLVGLWGLFFLVIYTHVLGWLWLPAVLLATLYPLRDRISPLSSFYKPPSLLLRAGVPILLLGGLVYFWMTDSATGPRSYDRTQLLEVAFLPIQSTEAAPLDRYNLLSANHFLDYANLLLFGALAPICILLTAVLTRIKLQGPVFSILLLTAVTYSATFFVLNPLLSMPVDRDLFLLPLIPLFLLALLVLREMEQHVHVGNSLYAVVFGVSILSSSFLLMQYFPEVSSRYVHSTGKWIFKTYYLGASTSLLERRAHVTSGDIWQHEFRETIAELEPYAVPERDPEYAMLLLAYGEDFVRVGDEKRYGAILEQALTYGPRYLPLIQALAQYYYQVGRFQDALPHADLLLNQNFPDRSFALSFAAQVYWKAGDVTRGNRYCQQFMREFPENTRIRPVCEQIARDLP